MSYPMVRDIANLNTAIKMAKYHMKVKIVFKPGLDWDAAIVYGCGDSSQGNVDDPTLGEETKSNVDT